MRGFRSITPISPSTLLLALALVTAAARAGDDAWAYLEASSGRSASLDIVFRAGAPTRLQEVYDFKFPCGHDDRTTAWSRYPDGRFQDEVYEEALGVKPVQVDPRRGVVRP